MAAESRAGTVWEGDLAHGAGTTTPDSGAFPAVEVSWASRTARAAGDGCPISGALKGNIDIAVEATLDS